MAPQVSFDSLFPSMGQFTRILGSKIKDGDMNDLIQICSYMFKDENLSSEEINTLLSLSKKIFPEAYKKQEVLLIEMHNKSIEEPTSRDGYHGIIIEILRVVYELVATSSPQ